MIRQRADTASDVQAFGLSAAYAAGAIDAKLIILSGTQNSNEDRKEDGGTSAHRRERVDDPAESRLSSPVGDPILKLWNACADHRCDDAGARATTATTVTRLHPLWLESRCFG